MIVGLISVRGDEDILEETLQYHLNNGVDCLGVIEHQISDASCAILDKFTDKIKERVRVSQPGFYPAVWLNELRRAMQHNLSLTTSDWFVHFDSDERWKGLSEAIEGVSDDVLVIESEAVVNYLPDKTIDADDVLGCDQRPKVMIRAASDLSTMTGQHRVARNQDGMPVPEDQIKTDAFTVHHYPVRSADQFLTKIHGMRQILEDGTHPEGRESYWLWREWVSVLNTGGEDAVRELFDMHFAATPEPVA